MNTSIKLVNTLKKEREQKSLTDKYSWLDPDDERKLMTRQGNISKIHYSK